MLKRILILIGFIYFLFLIMGFLNPLASANALPAPLPTISASVRNDITKVESGVGTPWGKWSEWVYCPQNTWAGAYSMRVEPSKPDNDDTALNAIKLTCVSKPIPNGQPGVSIQPHPGYWGSWGEQVSCPDNQRFPAVGSFFTHFRLKTEMRLPPGEDDTSVNSIAFRCNQGNKTIEARNGGPFGRWEEWRFPPNTNSAICGVKVRIEDPQGEDDDTAVNNLEFAWCSI